MSGAPAQCGRCVQWRAFGGSILPRVRRCGAVADLDAAPAAAALLGALAADLAAAGRCPNFDPGTDHPDAYRARDLDE